jgi:hypothetical protein
MALRQTPPRLNQAVVVDALHASEDDEPFPQGGGVSGKRLLWFVGKRTQASCRR